jgi:hypothetical protein
MYVLIAYPFRTVIPNLGYAYSQGQETGVSEYRNRLWRAKALHWRPVVRQGCKGETVPCWSEEEDQWDGSDPTIVFHETVSYL